jgi:hypothetical protein
MYYSLMFLKGAPVSEESFPGKAAIVAVLIPDFGGTEEGGSSCDSVSVLCASSEEAVLEVPSTDAKNVERPRADGKEVNPIQL